MIVTEKTEFYSNQYKNFRGGFGRGCGETHALPIFGTHLFFVITLKNYELCYLTLN